MCEEGLDFFFGAEEEFEGGSCGGSSYACNGLCEVNFFGTHLHTVLCISTLRDATFSHESFEPIHSCCFSNGICVKEFGLIDHSGPYK